MFSIYKKNIKRNLYKLIECLRKVVYRFENKVLTLYVPRMQRRKLKELQCKDIINVVFFAIDESDWKYGEVYRRMQASGIFHVDILVCPMVNRGRDTMLRTMNQCYNWFLENGYNVTLSYNSESGEYVDVKKLFNPDIIFYCNPYRGLIDGRYYITKFLDVLTIYTPYAFNNNSNFDFCYNDLLHNLVWRYYHETYEHKSYAQQSALNQGRNAVVTGYPGIEKLINGYEPATDPWKIPGNKLKKIIWAPHWTIQENGGCVNYSCFLSYADIMVKFAEKYKEKVQFVFKPHPLLRVMLEQVWGKKQTEEYYNIWMKMPNTNICETLYYDLFLTSDAMIHDSGSFINEYLYTNKPVMRTIKRGSSLDMYNPFTQEALKYYYKAYTVEDIEQFICNVIEGIDPLHKKRTDFIEEKLMPPEKKMPSENIVNDIIDSINNQKLY